MPAICKSILLLLLVVAASSAQTAYIDDNNPAAGVGNTHPWGQTAGFTTIHVYLATQLQAAGILPGSILTDIQVAPSSGSSGIYNAPNARLSVGHLAVPSIVAGAWESNLSNPTVIHDYTSGAFTFPWTVNSWVSLPGVQSAGFLWDGVTDIGIYYTSSPGTSGTFTAYRTNANPRHSVTVYAATTETPTSVAAFAMKAALTFLPGSPIYQENQGAATFLLNGLQGNLAAPTQVTEFVGTPVTVGFLSSNLGFGCELLLTIPEPLRALGSGAFQLPASQQIVNINLAAPSLFLLNNFSLPPFTGNFFQQVTGTAPLQVSAQMLVLDATNPDGFALSGPARLTIQ
ncbi:MAG TPA: hypothetical protein PKA37_13270 [Planctomycetota bacterium]|nr:hypothetical protein [Planctomycetota bacterium]